MARGRLLEWARVMRTKPTHAEEVLWDFLRDRQLCGAKFRRQHRLSNYICDFYCEEAKLVVECDGSAHDTATQIERDANRDRFLKANGLTILRFRNERILNDIAAVLHEIAAHLPAP